MQRVSRAIRALRRREDGQALVEFAVVANILIVLLLAIVQFGVVWTNYETVTDSAREGVRRAVVNRSSGQSAMVSAATVGARESSPDLNQANFSVSVTAPNGTWNQGDPITVTTSYPYSISIFGWAVKSGYLQATATMRAE
jgi:Flp pilus assembly protein TadG